jgi:hypothetical protein
MSVTEAVMARSSATSIGPQLFQRAGRDPRRLLREVAGVAAILAFWVVLWLWAAATVTQPWAPDPETRAALIERTETVARSVQIPGR